MKVTITSQSEQALISLETAKAYLRITDSAQDSIIQVLIDAVIDQAERFMWRSLRGKTVECIFYDNNEVYIPHAPIDAVTKVEYYNDDAWTVITEADGFNQPVDYDDVVTLKYSTMRVTYTSKVYENNDVRAILLDIILAKYEKRGEHSDLVKSLTKYKRLIAL